MNRLTIYLLVLGIFLVGSGEFVVSGVLNFIADDLGISIAAAGQLITAFSLSFAIGTPILVSLTSRLRRKSLLLCSMAIFIIGCGISFVSTEYVVLLISRIILGVGAGVFSVVAISSVTKLVPPEKMGGAISMISLAFGLALTLGVPIGIAISNQWSWQVIFAVLGIAGIVVIIGLIRLLPHIEGDAPMSFWQQFRVLKNPVMISALFLGFVLCVSHSIMLTYLTPFLKNILQLNASEVGAVMLVLGIAGIIGSRLGGYGTDKWGAIRTISITVILSALSLVLLPITTTLLYVGLTLTLIWTLTVYMITPAVQSYFIQLEPQSANIVMSLNTSLSHLGLAVGAALGGMLVDFSSTVEYHPWTSSCFYTFALLVAITTFSLGRRRLAQAAV